MKSKKTATVDIQELVNGYDGVMFNPGLYEYLDYSDFLNYGYWDATTANQKEASEKLMEKMLSFMVDKKGKILDVACGKGASTQYLMRAYSPENIFGINISEKQLRSARDNAPGCTFLKMNATRLEFADNSFENIICVEAAFHFDTREDFLKEAHRVLKPGGCLVLSDILMNQEAEQRRKYRTERNYVASLDEYREILQNAGFEKVQVVDATKPCWEGHFWGVVNYFHEKFFNKEITQEQLSSALARTHLVAPDIMHYVLVKVVKRIKVQ